MIWPEIKKTQIAENLASKWGFEPRSSETNCDVATGLTIRSKVGEFYVSGSPFQPYIYPKRPSHDSRHVTPEMLQSRPLSSPTANSAKEVG